MKLTKTQAAPFVKASFPDYTGRKFHAQITKSVWFHDLNWGGGSRNQYVALTRNGDVRGMLVEAPWKECREGQEFEIPAGVFVVEHCYFCGHDMGITIYVNPADAPKELEA